MVVHLSWAFISRYYLITQDLKLVNDEYKRVAEFFYKAVPQRLRFSKIHLNIDNIALGKCIKKIIFLLNL